MLSHSKKGVFFGMLLGFTLWSLKTAVEYSTQQKLFLSPSQGIQNIALASFLALPLYIFGGAILFGLIAWMIFYFEKI